MRFSMKPYTARMAFQGKLSRNEGAQHSAELFGPLVLTISPNTQMPTNQNVSNVTMSCYHDMSEVCKNDSYPLRPHSHHIWCLHHRYLDVYRGGAIGNYRVNIVSFFWTRFALFHVRIWFMCRTQKFGYNMHNCTLMCTSEKMVARMRCWRPLNGWRMGFVM